MKLTTLLYGLFVLALLLPFASATDASVITYWLDNGQNAGAGPRTTYTGETVNFKVYADPCYDYDDCQEMDLKGVILDANNNIVEELFDYNNLREVFGDDETSVFSFTPQTEGTYYIVVDTNGAQNNVCENVNSCSVLRLNVENEPQPPEEIVWGCTDETALNYDSEANRDNGSCNHNPTLIVGRPPVYEESNNVFYYTGSIGREFYVFLRGIDQDGDELTFTKDGAVNGEGSSPQRFTIENHPTTNTAHFRWVPSETGTFAVNLIARDGRGGRDSQIVVFTIGNHAPTLDVTPQPDEETSTMWKYNVYTNEPINLAITAQDSDNDELAISFGWMANEYLSPDVDFSYGDATAGVQWTPEESGEYGFKVRVTDHKVFTEKAIVFNVVDPVLRLFPVGDYSLNEESNVISFPLAVAQYNPFHDDVTYDVRVKREACTGRFCIPESILQHFLPEEAGFDRETGTFTFTPTYDTVKHPNTDVTYMFRFRAYDGFQYSEWVRSTITVDDVNREPVVTLLYPEYLTVNQEGRFGAFIVRNDPDNDDLTFVWNFDEMTNVQGQFVDYVFDSVGVHDGTLTIDDGFGDVLEFPFTVDVREEEPVIIVPVNHAPTIKGITDKEVDEDETLQFTIDATDEDRRDTLTYEMRLVEPRNEFFPSTGSFDSATGDFEFTPNFSFVAHPNMERFFVLEFRAVDNHQDASAWDRVTITVHDVNRNPEITEFTVPTQVVVGQEFSVSGNAVDADNDDLTLEWIFENDATTRVNGPEATYTFSHVGQFSVGFYVHDKFGGSDFRIAILTVEEVPVCTPASVAHGDVSAYPACIITCDERYTLDNNKACVEDIVPVENHAPIIESMEPIHVLEGESRSFQIPASDIDGDELRYFMTEVSSNDALNMGFLLDDVTGEIQLQPTFEYVAHPARERVVTFSFRARDRFVYSEWVELDVIVDDVNRNPVIDDITSPGLLMVDEEGHFSATAHDPDGDELDYMWQFETGGNLYRSQNVDFVYNAPGHYGFSVLVTDDYQGSTQGEGSVLVVEDVSEVCTPASVAHGDVSAYPACTITCDTNYHVESNACVADPEPEF
ncbi:hypothetical protein COV17_03955, partial [Candidatus Woesearchaeota archaeon CG10_big_fil_rev_8_21_14_0_10_36_11]